MTSDDSAEGRHVHGRVLMLAPDPTIWAPVPGPIGKLAYRLADALRAVGYAVDTELWGRHVRDEGPVRKVLGRAADLIRIRGRIGRGSYDLVFVNTSHDWRALARDLLLVLPSSARVRWVLLIHGSHFRPGHRLVDLGTRRLVRRVSAVLLLSSEEVAEWTRLYPRGRYRLVANALAPTPPAMSEPPRGVLQPGRPELLFVGSLIREKGLYELLEAFATVRSKRVCHLTVVGEGTESEKLRLRASQLGVAEDVEFTGYLREDDVGRFYRRAGVLVLPSYSEGLPTVILEAMSFGLPIVTTRIRGAADHLVEGENVLFVPPRTSAPLAAALERLLEDESLRATMGENNRRKAESFAPDRVVQAYVRVFEEVMGEEGGL
jgi:glycosyltransferase involved in cell wall biosynthesis